MSNALFESGRNAFAAGTANWATGKGASGTIQAILMNTTVFTGTGIKQITGATTGATAAAVACVNAFTAGDVIIIGGVLGTTTANGLWVVGSGVSGTSIPLFDYYTGIQGTLAGTYTSGGYAVNLGTTRCGRRGTRGRGRMRRLGLPGRGAGPLGGDRQCRPAAKTIEYSTCAIP